MEELWSENKIKATLVLKEGSKLDLTTIFYYPDLCKNIFYRAIERNLGIKEYLIELGFKLIHIEAYDSLVSSGKIEDFKEGKYIHKNSHKGKKVTI
jgi:hypothetical protein